MQHLSVKPVSAGSRYPHGFAHMTNVVSVSISWQAVTVNSKDPESVHCSLKLVETSSSSDIPSAVPALLPCRMEALPNGCSLNMMLLVETVADRIMRWMLPINVLRNYALLGADTRLVAMVDVDLLPSVGLADWLQLPGK